MRSPRVDHVSIGTLDPEHFHALLTEVLGFETGPSTRNLIDRGAINELFGWAGGESPVPRTTYYGRPGEFRIEVVHMEDAEEIERSYARPPQAILHIGVYVDDLEETLERARELGVDHVGQPIEFERGERHFSAGFVRTRGVEFELLQDLKAEQPG